MTELKGGQTYEKLNSFLDTGDCGNMWMAAAPEQNAIVRSLGRPARVSCVQNGSLAVKFRIETAFEVPAYYDFAKQVRSREQAELSAVTEVTLKKGSRYVEVRTTFRNTAKDHHLKVCFPTGLAAKTTAADGSFSVVEYSTTPDLRCDLARHPAQLWFDTSDGKNGLAVLSRSTKDYEIIDENGGKTMAMGLVRGVRLRIPCDNRLWMEYPGDESAQSIGELTHDYAILPHQKSWKDAGLYQDALRFNQPLKPCQFGKQDGSLPRKKSFLAISDGRLVLAAVKKAEDRDSLVVRLFNPTTEKIETDITVGFPAAKANIVKLTEEPAQKLDLKKGRVHLTVGKGQILSVEFALKT